jgi:Ran GTPase-activating protein (RanGAP) involved in mRNA processing and transport
VRRQLALSTSSITELYIDGLIGPRGVLTSGLIDEEGARVLASGLARNDTLKVLAIYSSRNISDISWQSIFTAFENLILDSNGLNDATIHPLSNVLLHKTTLRSLILVKIADVPLAPKRLITNNGWVNLFTSLRSIMLEKLSICGNSIGDIGVKALANALVNNSCLRELDLSYNSISGAGVNALASVLHNPNSA